MNKILPPDWSWVKLGDVSEILDNKRIPINFEEREKRILGKSKESLFPYYGATGQVGFIDNYLLDGEFILLGEDGAPFLERNKTKAYIVNGKIWVNNHAHILVSKSNNKFLCYYLNYIDYQPYVTGTTRLKLNQSSMKQIPVLYPPISEQNRIIDKLEELFSELDKGIENLRKSKEQIKTYRQSVLAAAFSGRLTENKSHENELTPETHSTKLAAEPKTEYGTGNLPEGWKWKSLREITTILGDGLHGTPEYSSNGDYYFINGNNLSDGRIDIKSNTKRVSHIEYEKYKKDLNDRTIFVSINGTLGKTAFYNNEKVILGKSACYFNIYSNYDKRYVRYFLKTQRFINYANDSATGSTIKNVSLNAMRELLIPIPPNEELQIFIVSEIERRFSVADKLEQTIDESLKKADLLKQSILKQAFEGKLVLP